MRVVHVDVHVVPEHVEEFLEQTRRNAAASRREPGVLRFDVVQDRTDPAHVVLIEVYADEEAPTAHKATAHYAQWRDAVAAWMARPRTAVTFDPVDPVAEDGWRAGA
ncbi:MAG: putative quinol monooxygenase [Jiangellales bacterium]